MCSTPSTTYTNCNNEMRRVASRVAHDKVEMATITKWKMCVSDECEYVHREGEHTEKNEGLTRWQRTTKSERSVVDAYWNNLPEQMFCGACGHTQNSHDYILYIMYIHNKFVYHVHTDEWWSSVRCTYSVYTDLIINMNIAKDMRTQKLHAGVCWWLSFG